LASGVVDTFTFNAADQMTNVASMKGGNTLFSSTYARDSANQVTSDSSAASGTGLYRYTALNQVCYAGPNNSNACASPPSGSIAYAYDAADNLTQKGSTQQAFNAADELCWTASTSGACASPPSGATTYQYDTRGNRTNVIPNVGQAQILTYDQADRLIKYAVASTTSYGYNADGLRMCKYTGSSAQPCQATGNTPYVWAIAGPQPLLIKDGITAFVYGPGGLPLEQVTTSATNWFHHDQLGSTRLVTDAAGSVQATYVYDPFGNLVLSTGSVVNPFRFGGQYLDSESGLYYLRARYYDSLTGQFLTTDPIVRVTREPYAFVEGDPLNATDANGLATGAICLSGGVTIPGIHIGASFCVVRDTHGNWGTTRTVAAGYGCCVSIGIMVMPQVSNANTIYDLAKQFDETGASVGDFIIVGAEAYHGYDSCGREIYGGGPGIGVGFGFPVEVHGGASYTSVTPHGGPGPVGCKC
jgi:RHS repeat-associated protein